MDNSRKVQGRTIGERFETARELLIPDTVEAAQRAIEELTPTLGRTCGISEFQTLADLLSRAYIITRELPLARQWLQYAPTQPGRADIRSSASR